MDGPVQQQVVACRRAVGAAAVRRLAPTSLIDVPHAAGAGAGHPARRDDPVVAGCFPFSMAATPASARKQGSASFTLAVEVGLAGAPRPPCPAAPRANMPAARASLDHALLTRASRRGAQRAPPSCRRLGRPRPRVHAVREVYWNHQGAGQPSWRRSASARWGEGGGGGSARGASRRKDCTVHLVGQHQQHRNKIVSNKAVAFPGEEPHCQAPDRRGGAPGDPGAVLHGPVCARFVPQSSLVRAQGGREARAQVAGDGCI